LLALAAGKRLHPLVDVREYAAQAVSDHGFWVRRAELVSSHPLLPKRVAALINAGISIPPREQWTVSSPAVAA
jgi:Zn-dependent protease with chaperone function